jgi:micrococcal nuclease
LHLHLEQDAAGEQLVMSLHRSILLVCGLVLAACQPVSAAQDAVESSPISTSEPQVDQVAEIQTATVVSTGDGDTLRVNQSGQTLTVRLGCIDSPEPDQPGGQASADRLRELLPRDQAIQLVPIDTDRYGRTVAVVFVNGQSVNLQLVQEGQAVVYPQYLSGCPNSRNDLLAAEETARSAGLGFWAQANPVMPWDWRQGNRISSPPVSPPVAAPVYPTEPSVSFPTEPDTTANWPACVNSDCDCKDFQTQAEAQRVFEAFAGDPFRLDGDFDGRVCEALP